VAAHAQLADYLCRSGDNGVGALIVDRLEKRGVSVDGDDFCRNQCDLCTPVAEAMQGWWYEPSKNKWKLRKRFRNRQATDAPMAPESEGTEGRRRPRTGGLEGRKQLERQRLGPRVAPDPDGRMEDDQSGE
jgi:hypothetical protein